MLALFRSQQKRHKHFQDRELFIATVMEKVIASYKTLHPF